MEFISNDTFWGTIHPSSMSSAKLHVLGGIYIGTSFLSIVGSASIVFAVIIKKKVVNAEVRPIFHLSLADLAASLVMLLGGVFYLKFGFDSTTRVFCSYVTAVSSCLYMNTFLFTALYGYEVYSKLTTRLTKKRRQLPTIQETFTQVYCLYSFAWIAPLAVTLCLFAIDSGEAGSGSLNDDICGTCLPVFHYRVTNCSAGTSSNEPNWNVVFQFVFLAVLGASMLTVIIVYILVLNTFRKVQISGGIMTRLQYKQETSVRRWACLYQVVFVICWLPSIILGLCSLVTSFHMMNYYPLYVVQAAITPLQGFFNCVIYGWRRTGFKKILKQRNYQSISENNGSRDFGPTL